MTITQKQCLLTYLGYDTGGVDGIWGEKSLRAAEAFRRDHGLGEGEDLEAKLRSVIASEEAPQDWWQNIRYWTREEFKCRCGEYHAPYCNGFPVEPDRTLVELADDVRAHFGRPANHTSGIRCQKHNADSGGKANSRHLYGKALDFWVSGVSGEKLLAYVLSLPGVNFAYQITDSKTGKLTDCVHMDVK